MTAPSSNPVNVRNPRRWCRGVIAALGLLPLTGCTILYKYPVTSQREAEIRALREAPPTEAAAARRRFADEHTDWPEDMRAAIEAGEVRMDMSREQLLYAWGFPTSRWPYPPTVDDLEEWRYSQVKPTIVVDVTYAGVCRMRYSDADYPDFEHKPPKGRFGYQFVGDTHK